MFAFMFLLEDAVFCNITRLDNRRLVTINEKIGDFTGTSIEVVAVSCHSRVMLTSERETKGNCGLR